MCVSACGSHVTLRIHIDNIGLVHLVLLACGCVLAVWRLLSYSPFAGWLQPVLAASVKHDSSGIGTIQDSYCPQGAQKEVDYTG